MNPKEITPYTIARSSALIIAIILIASSAIGGRIPLFLLLNKDFGTIADDVLLGFTYLAEGWMWIPYLMIVGWFLKKDKTIIIYCFAISTLLTQIPKLIFFPNITRPIASGIDPNLIHKVEGVVMHQLSSFPSGHTATAFTIFLLTIYLFDHKKMVLMGLIYAMLCAYSRVYLGQHFPLDLGGGILVAILTVEISKRIRKNNKDVKEI
jgi:membrane-associated phospholipid phosphatase